MTYWEEKKLKKFDKIEISIIATPWRICVPKTLDGVDLAKKFLTLLKKKYPHKEV